MKSLMQTAIAVAIGLNLMVPAQAAPESLKSEKLAVVEGRNLSVDGSIQGKAAIDYRVPVRKGQILTVGLTSENLNVRFNVVAPTGGAPLFNGASSGNQYEEAASQDGEYVLRVYLLDRALHKLEPTRFKLGVGVGAGQG